MELDLYEILGEKKEGTRLYSPICGELLLKEVTPNGVFCKQPFGCMDDNHNLVFMDDGHFKNYGVFADNGECVLFPSKEMRDWEKFCWKRGDVVMCGDGAIVAIFDGWANDTYDKFNTAYSYEAEDSSYNEEVVYVTCDFRKASDGDSLRFIAYLEKEYHGKLNADTLEIEPINRYANKLRPRFEKGDFFVMEVSYSDSSDVHKYVCIYNCYDWQTARMCCFASLNTGESDTPEFDCPHKLYDCNFPINSITMRLANGDEKAMLVNALLGVGKRWDDKRMEIIDYNPQVNNTEKKLNDFNFRAFDLLDLICRYQKRIEARHLKEYNIFTEYLWRVDELPKNCIAPVPDAPSEPTTEDVQSVISSVSCYDPQIELPGEKSNASDLYDGVWKKLKKDSEEQQTNA